MNSIASFTHDIRIVGLNTGKTRRTPGSYTVYRVYFKLSGAPSTAWSDIFGREWRDVNQTQEAGVDGQFLVIDCPLRDIATTHLPALERAVRATNVAHRQYAREQAAAEERQAAVWKQDRKAVRDLAKTLQFGELK
jgi:hypothetical protein